MKQQRFIVAAVSAAVFFAVAVAMPGAASAAETVHACDGGVPNYIWGPFGNAIGPCAGNGSLEISSNNVGGSRGRVGGWTAWAPPGLMIVGTTMPRTAPRESPAPSLGSQWGTEYQWAGGGDAQAFIPTYCPAGGLSPCGGAGFPASFASQWFVIQLDCDLSTCSDGAVLEQPSPDLVVDDTVAPTLAAGRGSLGASGGWVRGSWPLALTGDSPSGLCSMTASLAGLGVGSATWPQDVAAWKQCNGTQLTGSVDTTRVPDGTTTFQASATDATGLVATVSASLGVDNTTPQVTLSGPADVASGLGGPAQVTATATAGPSGVGTIDCNVDGTSETFPAHGAPTATATVTVSGLGAHSVSCVAENTAVDAQGAPATSPLATRTVLIRTPTAAVASFNKLVDRLACHRALRRVRVPAGWHWIRWHHHRVRARLPSHTVKTRVRVCQERLVRRRIAVWRTVRRHGHRVRVKHYRTVRVPIAPHTVVHTVRDVAFGRRTQVSGWLGTGDGVALGGQEVEVYGAPDNGQGDFAPLAHATTDADGFWQTKLAAGPGRILEAQYGGTDVTEPTVSGQIKTVVHARVQLAPIYPRAVAWAGRIILAGTLPDGYVPPGGINIRLRYGIGFQSETYGVREHVGTQGTTRFKVHFQFGAGPAASRARFWFQLCTLPGANYPFAPGCSARQSIEVGGDPARARHHQRRRRHRHRHRR